MIEDLNHLLRANHGVLGGGSERAVRLSAIAPHASADPFPRHSFANLINDARTIAVRNDPWLRHPDVKRVFMKAAWYERQGAAGDVLVLGEMEDAQPRAGEVRDSCRFFGRESR